MHGPKRKKNEFHAKPTLAPVVEKPRPTIRYNDYIDWRRGVTVGRASTATMKSCEHNFVGNFRIEITRGTPAVEGSGQCTKCGITIHEVVYLWCRIDPWTGEKLEV